MIITEVIFIGNLANGQVLFLYKRYVLLLFVKKKSSLSLAFCFALLQG